MFIQTESTPNPATLKFLPGVTVMDSNTANFTSADEAQLSPLARSLFDVGGVTGVFLGAEFISVTKTDEKGWDSLKPLILGCIIDHFQSCRPMIVDAETPGDAGATGVVDDHITQQIKELINTRVRPAVAQDGGDIIYEGFKDGIVFLQMQGACSGCPSSTATLKHGIENMLRYYIPEVTEVRAVE